MGNLVAHKVAEKIFKIDNHIAATIAGYVAGAQGLMKIISAETALYRLRNGKDISIEAAASVSSNILRSSPAYVQTLIGGVDDTGASIYSLDAAGGMIKDTFISTGSGSTFAYGVLEDRFHEDITVEEAKELALRAIKAATERDTYSGNGFLVAEVTKDGFKMLEKEEVESIIEKINK
jgi:proteasome beta subunit